MRKKVIAGAFGAFGLSMVLGIGSAYAAPPGVEGRPSPANANANCVGVASSANTHNGQAPTLGQGGDPSHGARGNEIKAFQASC
jgi:hypothetical protein